MELSAQKATEVAKLQTEDCLVLGADTIVAVGEEILGKPKDEQDALRDDGGKEQGPNDERLDPLIVQ